MELAQRIHKWVIPLAQEVCEEIERKHKLTKEEIDKIESELTRRMNELMGPPP